MIEKQETRGSLALAQDCSKNVHQLAGFSGETPALFFQDRVTSAIDQPEPISRLFGFLSTDLYTQLEVLFAHRLVRLDLTGTHRAGGANQLLDIFEILYRSRKLSHGASRFLREQKRPLFQIVGPFIARPLIFLHFFDSSSNCFGFRISDFQYHDHTT
jgi:hypothetical protein